MDGTGRYDTGRDDERNEKDSGFKTKAGFNVFALFQTTLSFLVYDRDSNWQGQSDDFMGSCNLQMTLVRNILFHSIGRMQRNCVEGWGHGLSEHRKFPKSGRNVAKIITRSVMSSAFGNVNSIKKPVRMKQRFSSVSPAFS